MQKYKKRIFAVFCIIGVIGTLVLKQSFVYLNIISSLFHVIQIIK